MTIRRFGIKAASGFSKLENTYGAFVTFDDHEADKAEAVAVEVAKTEELRAELLAVLEASFRGVAWEHNGWWRVLLHRVCCQLGRQLVATGKWESKVVGGVTFYRPVEPQDSGGKR